MSSGKTKTTEIVGGSDYKGYNSRGFDTYDEITDTDKDKANNLGGIFDNDAKSYGKNRFKFRTKEDRDKFNQYLDKKENKKNKNIKEMVQRIYNVGDLRRIIKESSENQEFKPVMGNGVEKDNKSNNEKAYKDMEKATAKYDGGMTKEKHFKLSDYDDNRGMESLRINNPNKPYSDRVKAQLKGFPSAAAEEIHKNEKLGNAEYGSDETVQQFKNKSQKFIDGRKKATEIGLTGRELNKQEIANQYNSIFNENKKMKKLTFKNTVFLNENHMLTRVPDSYMTEGNKFIMRDKNSNEYIVEWHNEDKPLVKRHFTKENILEEQSRMKHLFEYKSGDVNKQSTPSSRLNENNELNTMLNKVRGLMK